MKCKMTGDLKSLGLVHGIPKSDKFALPLHHLGVHIVHQLLRTFVHLVDDFATSLNVLEHLLEDVGNLHRFCVNSELGSLRVEESKFLERAGGLCRLDQLRQLGDLGLELSRGGSLVRAVDVRYPGLLKQRDRDTPLFLRLVRR